jgi:hypothetical protein
MLMVLMQQPLYSSNGITNRVYATIDCMKIKRTGMKVASDGDQELGVYLWKLPNGNWLADEDGNMLSCDSLRGDLRVMSEMAAAAREVGYPDGQAIWEAAHKVTNEQYEEQVAELLSGRNPTVRIGRR